MKTSAGAHGRPPFHAKIRLVGPGGTAILRMTGRCRSGGDSTGTRYHAVPDGRPESWQLALCGAKPGERSNGWSTRIGDAVTCPRCLKRMADG
jgi:hypothetical protein